MVTGSNRLSGDRARSRWATPPSCQEVKFKDSDCPRGEPWGERTQIAVFPKLR